MVGAPSVAVGTLPSYRLSLVRIEEAGTEPWLAEVEGLPSCTARGSTPDEAVRRAWAAVEELVGRLPEEENEPPAPRHSGKLLVRMPATLHDELAQTAESEGVSLNQLITGVLAASVEWRSTGGGAGSESKNSDSTSATRVDRMMLAANFAVVTLVALLALALLVTAWRG